MMQPGLTATQAGTQVKFPTLSVIRNRRNFLFILRDMMVRIRFRLSRFCADAMVSHRLLRQRPMT